MIRSPPICPGNALPLKTRDGNDAPPIEPGQMGGDRITIQNLEVVKVDAERNVILIKGNVPGSKKSLVEIKTAIKSK